MPKSDKEIPTIHEEESEEDNSVSTEEQGVMEDRHDDSSTDDNSENFGDETMFNDNDVDIQEVLSTFFQNDDGANIPEQLDNLKFAVDNNSKCILKVAKAINRLADLYEMNHK